MDGHPVQGVLLPCALSWWGEVLPAGAVCVQTSPDEVLPKSIGTIPIIPDGHVTHTGWRTVMQNLSSNGGAPVLPNNSGTALPSLKGTGWGWTISLEILALLWLAISELVSDWLANHTFPWQCSRPPCQTGLYQFISPSSKLNLFSPLLLGQLRDVSLEENNKLVITWTKKKAHNGPWAKEDRIDSTAGGVFSAILYDWIDA